ncbi:NAD(P)-binding protein [Aspergillus sclerotioniger CBS 115572]|uniref:NAD(P)-binding protein n=1 Tax=Aspergillus sclerotioniger CBS 115572 TaxID=1450535 RepID=A0A317X8G0_9EURO|nr:NAD(P)-binding protein [Aspergillus sclerotioniger CBS 115572]PWY94565.1 NAD(P)-binding protein [Aspergillus sclerotioniger CBS 115572]
MITLTQPKISPLPNNINLTGKTAIITGASAGIGLELTKQLLQLRISTIILAVRNITKGEACVQSLRQDPIIKTHNPNAVIKVLELDMDRYDSVQGFAKQAQGQIPSVDFLILNAGTGLITLERSPSGHERTVQVNYYSNVLLIAELLPLLHAGAEKNSVPGRITWVGSRRHLVSSLEKKAFMVTEDSVLEYVDSEEGFIPFSRYGDSKLLCVLFMYALAEKLDSNKVVINMMCPGMVNTGMSDVLPLYIRFFFNVLKAIKARSVKTAGWIVLHSALVAGPESHGRFLNDKTVAEKAPYIMSPEGQEVQRKVWDETMVEMSKLTTLPAEFR